LRFLKNQKYHRISRPITYFRMYKFATLGKDAPLPWFHHFLGNKMPHTLYNFVDNYSCGKFRYFRPYISAKPISQKILTLSLCCRQFRQKILRLSFINSYCRILYPVLIGLRKSSPLAWNNLFVNLKLPPKVQNEKGNISSIIPKIKTIKQVSF